MSTREFVAPEAVITVHSTGNLIGFSGADENGNGNAIAGLTAEGQVLAFAIESRYNMSRGADTSGVDHLLASDVVQIYSHGYGYAALKTDNTIVTWGERSGGVRSYDPGRSVETIVSSSFAFVALLDDGSLDAWGDSARGGSLPSELVGITGVQKVVAIGWGFAALLDNGEVVSWGSKPYASDPDSNPEFTPGDTKVVDLVSSRGSFAALRDDGTVVHWAGWVFNNDTSQRHQHHLANVFDWDGPDGNLKAEKIYSGNYGVSVVRSDSSIASFARSTGNGLIDIDNSGLKIEKMLGGDQSFAAIRSDGSVIAWGSWMPGPTVFYDGYAVKGGVVNLDVGSPPVRKPVDLAYSGSQYSDAYAVLFDDGTVQTFGASSAGGGSLSSLNLNGSDGSLTVVSLLGGGKQFSALRSDGSVVSWGDGAPSEATPAVLSSGVAKLYSASLALKEDGSFVIFDNNNIQHTIPEVPLIALADPTTDERLTIPGIIESGGAITLQEDIDGYAWVKLPDGNMDDITSKNKPVGNDTYAGWTVAAAETINSKNKVIWKNENGKLAEWTTNDDWNRTSSKKHTPCSNSYLALEEDFQMDFDGDGTIGRAYTTVESDGDIELQKDSCNMYWVKLPDGSQHEITSRNVHVGSESYSGWTLIAAEIINGANKIIWTNGSGKFSEWTVNQSWNRQSRQVHDLDTVGYYSMEESFQMDFDTNGVIGRTFSTIESTGNVALQLDSAGMAWVQLTDGSREEITVAGTQVGSATYEGWSLVAAETIEDQNIVIWKNAENELRSWSVSTIWNHQITTSHETGTDGFFTVEENLQMDFDLDGVIGRTYESIESSGVIELEKDSCGLAWAKSEDGTRERITSNGVHVGPDTYAGWDIIAAEIIEDQNKVIWIDEVSNQIAVWNVDADWKIELSIKYNPGTEGFIAIENSFQMDLDSDGRIGNHYNSVEADGSIELQKDATGLYWIKSANNELTAITRDGMHVGDKTYTGWSITAAETIDGINKAIWQSSSSTSISEWALDSTWTFVSTTSHSAGTDSFYQMEESFQMDFDDDGLIGPTYTTVESDGIITLEKDNSGNNWVRLADGSLDDITSGGQRVGDSTYEGWSIVAAETIGDQNTVIWLDESKNMAAWNVDGYWDLQLSIRHTPDSESFNAVETSFQMDFDGDGTIGS